MKYIALDFETAYWGPANACSLGIVTSDGHEVIDEWYHLIHPLSLNFDEGCSKINGIYPEDVIDEDEFPYFWKDIAMRLEGGIVFAHNARFDMGVLASAIDTYQLPDIHFRYGDTVVLSRKLWADLPNHKLNTVAEKLGFTFNHHQELDDARACEYIVRSAIEKTGTPDAEALMKMTGQQLKRFAIKRGAKRLLAP